MQRRLRNSAAVVLLTSAGLSTGIATAQAAGSIGATGTPQAGTQQADAPAAATPSATAPSTAKPPVATPPVATPPVGTAPTATSTPTATTTPAAGASKAATPQVGPQQAGTKPVDYQGYQLKVPTSWQVVDLTQDPHTCIRFDENVVYLGTPGRSRTARHTWRPAAPTAC